MAETVRCVAVMVRRVQLGWERWWHRLQPMRVQREQNASDTRAKRGHNAKSNASLTRSNAGNNAGWWHRLQPVRAAYPLYFRELLPDRERNSENYYPALVNSELASRPAFSPARQPALRAGTQKKRSSVFICGRIGFFSQLLTGGAEGTGRFELPTRAISRPPSPPHPRALGTGRFDDCGSVENVLQRVFIPFGGPQGPGGHSLALAAPAASVI
jgi:hypothetical protein